MMKDTKMPYTCIISYVQQGASTLVPKRNSQH